MTVTVRGLSTRFTRLRDEPPQMDTWRPVRGRRVSVSVRQPRVMAQELDGTLTLSDRINTFISHHVRASARSAEGYRVDKFYFVPMVLITRADAPTLREWFAAPNGGSLIYNNGCTREGRARLRARGSRACRRRERPLMRPILHYHIASTWGLERFRGTSVSSVAHLHWPPRPGPH